MTNTGNKIEQGKLLGGGPGDLPIVHTLYHTYREWSEMLMKFPKVQRYTLGEIISQNLLTSLELLLAAASMSNPAEKLIRLFAVSAKIDLLKLLIRLSKDTKCLPNEKYLKLESLLIDAGKMLGGWIKNLEQHKGAQ